MDTDSADKPPAKASPKGIRDLTEGAIGGHIVAMAAPIAIGMFVQTLYVLIDLYFVSRIGGDAVAGVSAGNTVFFVVMGLTQMVSVATLALMSQAIGAKNLERASLIFNQSVLIAALFAGLTLIAGYGGAETMMGALGADDNIRAAGVTYLYWYLPGLALQFCVAVIGSALRAAGVTKPTMMVQIISVGCNIILAPVLITGWGTGVALGVAGAGLASSLSVVVSLVLIAFYFARTETFVRFAADQIKPRLATWGEMLRIGGPSGGEFILLAVFTGVIYFALRGFGPETQAGYAIGGRIMQMMFLPAMAIAFALPAIAGQNFGARKGARVRETFSRGVVIESGLMLLLALLCQVVPEPLTRLFTNDPEVIESSVLFLRVISINFVATGIVFACSGMFQALGNTVPALLSSGLRLITFVTPVIWLTSHPGFRPIHIWMISVASTTFQALVSWLLLRWQMNKKLAAFG